ncbi:methyltransferase [Streptomyces sp. NPDC101225]|uniref:methyltransferase n=1 Tax=Streptomyces sp. NPDC101225 TaxID=3366135 RepID=UPI0037FB5382
MTEPMPQDRDAIMSTVFGHMEAQTLGAAVRLGVADRLGDQERDAADVAAGLGTDPDATRRLLRALAGSGLAAEVRPGVFALTPRGALLRTDHPDSVAAFVAMFTDRTTVGAWSHLDDSVRTGRAAFDELYGTDFFGHLAAHPELSRAFNAAMRQGTGATAQILKGELGLAGAASVTDVGGGDGTLLAALLTAHPHLRGVLFETPRGAAEAGPLLDAAGVAGRCEVVTGDFLVSVPAGSDVCLLKGVVKDWDDDRAATILANVRAALPREGRLLIIEVVMPETVDGSVPPVMYIGDLHMLANVSGRERTEAEYRSLCGRAGFRVAEVRRLPHPSPISVIEALPA